MSRLTMVISKVERGEPVDLKRVSLLLALDTAAADEAFVQEMSTLRNQADDQLAVALGVAPGS